MVNLENYCSTQNYTSIPMRDHAENEFDYVDCGSLYSYTGFTYMFEKINNIAGNTRNDLTRAANGYLSLDRRVDLGLYSSPF